MIETNDSGPFGADVWWLLFGADDRIAVAFPQGATGEQAGDRLADRAAGLRPRGDDHGDGLDRECGLSGLAPRSPECTDVRALRPQNSGRVEPLSRPVADHAIASACLGRIETLVGHARRDRRGSGSEPPTVATPMLTEQGVARVWLVATTDCRMLSPSSLPSGCGKAQRMANSSPPIRNTLSSEPTARTSNAGNHLQHLVAFRMAEAVVDRLEVIGVDDQQRQRPCRCAGLPRPPARRARRTCRGEAAPSGRRGRPARPALRSARGR